MQPPSRPVTFIHESRLFCSLSFDTGQMIRWNAQQLRRGHGTLLVQVMRLRCRETLEFLFLVWLLTGPDLGGGVLYLVECTVRPRYLTPSRLLTKGGRKLETEKGGAASGQGFLHACTYGVRRRFPFTMDPAGCFSAGIRRREENPLGLNMASARRDDINNLSLPRESQREGVLLFYLWRRSSQKLCSQNFHSQVSQERNSLLEMAT